MKVYNSTKFAMSQLRPLINFVTMRCESSVMAHLFVTDDPDPGHRYMSGYSWKREGNDITAPSRVIIWFASKSYPKTHTYRMSVGPVRVKSWQEEFVHTLAHEMRHIDQYWTTKPQPRHYEVDAEKFANKVLAEYKKSSLFASPPKEMRVTNSIKRPKARIVTVNE